MKWFKLANKKQSQNILSISIFLGHISSLGFQTYDFCCLFSAAATHKDLVNVEVCGWTENVE